ncbi:MAG: glycogen/starch synthase, partial [Alloscardovia omnicolens]|nr:glycogen/starch synthase [Alloscardovia omnicolens]
MKVLFVAAEGSPFAKVGGLGDVIGALPKSLATRGHEVAVVMPYYDTVARNFADQVEDVMYFFTNVGWRHEYVGVKRLELSGVTFYFIDNERYFFRGHVYGDMDDGERF